jgi:CheY-like chemotaxis protein
MKHGPLILVVDDEHSIADFFAELLERRGFKTARAYCGLTGLAMAKVLRPELVLLNLMMPGMGGVQVLRELRADPRTAGMKVIMTSGSILIPEIAAKEGAQGFLLYPVKVPEFDRKVDAVLRPG